MTKPELLAPAGDINRLKTALTFGADAVYISGKDYSLRANANNFTNYELKEAVSFAHSLNKKVYVTVNMFFHNEDFTNIDEFLLELKNINVDGVIVSDVSIINKLKKLGIFTVLSTQMSVSNYEALKFNESLGIKRAVLARECSYEDILEMKNKTNMELEVFIHGAMCTSYSGRCVMSNYVTLRDSNRGGCSQICRYVFDAEGYDPTFQMCSKDLNMVDYLKDLMEADITSFKIEGRMKSMYYIATVVNAYRVLIDKIYDNSITSEDIAYYKKVLSRVSNRDNKPQFLFGKIGVDDQYYVGRQEISNQDFLALVISYDEKSGYATVEQRNNFSLHQHVEVFGPHTNAQKLVIKDIIDSNNNRVESAPHPQEIVKIKLSHHVQSGDIIRRYIA